jgi:membrane protease subunit HflK
MNGDPPNPGRSPAPPPTPVTPEDAGSQALAEALRSSFGLVKVVMVLLVLVFLGSGFFTVGPQQRAIILRFGKPVGPVGRELLGPGLHWSYPYPIDEVIKIAISEVQRVDSTVGWYATREQELVGNVPMAGGSLQPGIEGYVLTADQNTLHARATLSYRVTEPVRFLFDYVNATNVIQDALDNALVYAAGRFTVDEIRTKEIEKFKETVRRRASDRIEAQQVGVLVDTCDVETEPPRFLADAFRRVTTAASQRESALNQARTYENTALSKASADAASRINTAEAERTRLVKGVESDAERFKELLPMVRTNRDLIVQQRLTETIARVMTNAQDKYFLPDNPEGRARELRLLLNREPPKPRGENPAQP